MHLDYRLFQAGDENKILDLFKITFKKEMSLEYWNWRFLNNPYGDVQIALAFDQEKLVGHYAISPIDFTSNGKTFKVAHSMTTMTHPDYQGMGIFNKLASLLYSNLKESSYDLVWGFPNSNSYYGFMKNLSWKPSQVLTTLKCSEPVTNPNLIKLTLSKDSFSNKECNLFDSDKIQIKKDANYFDWRYKRNPENEYFFIKCHRDDSLVGLFVVKNFMDELDVLEAAFESEHAANCIEALRYRMLGLEKKRTLNMWCSIFDDNYLSVLKNRFTPAQPLTYMGFLELRGNIAKSINEFHNWNISMGDSDVF